QDPVSGLGQQDDGGIDRVGSTGQAEQDAGLAAIVVIYGADIDRAQQSRQVHLAALLVTPDQGDHHRVAAQLHSALLGHTQPGDHRAVVVVDGHQCPSVENQGAHAAVSLAGTPSSCSARAISCGVSAPCSASQPTRNSASASARSLLAAASASHDDRGLPAREAADRTASPSSGSNETLSLSTFIRRSYHGSSYHGRKSRVHDGPSRWVLPGLSWSFPSAGSLPKETVGSYGIASRKPVRPVPRCRPAWLCRSARACMRSTRSWSAVASVNGASQGPLACRRLSMASGSQTPSRVMPYSTTIRCSSFPGSPLLTIAVSRPASHAFAEVTLDGAPVIREVRCPAGRAAARGRRPGRRRAARRIWRGGSTGGRGAPR